MCQSQAEGGRRCYAHQRQRVDKLEQRLAETSPDTAEHEGTDARVGDIRSVVFPHRREGCAPCPPPTPKSSAMTSSASH